MLSLMATGTPASAGSSEFARPLSDALLPSIFSARSKAPTRSIWRNALSVSFSFSAAVTENSTTASEVVWPLAICLLNNYIAYINIAYIVSIHLIVRWPLTTVIDHRPRTTDQGLTTGSLLTTDAEHDF